jgi:hypothetical protein
MELLGDNSDDNKKIDERKDNSGKDSSNEIIVAISDHVALKENCDITPLQNMKSPHDFSNKNGSSGHLHSAQSEQNNENYHILPNEKISDLSAGQPTTTQVPIQ